MVHDNEKTGRAILQVRGETSVDRGVEETRPRDHGRGFVRGRS